MTQYLITKREKCDHTKQPPFNGQTWIGPSGETLCRACRGYDYIDTPVDLLEVLAKVRWTEIGDIITKDGYEKGVVDLRFNNLTIED